LADSDPRFTARDIGEPAATNDANVKTAVYTSPEVGPVSLHDVAVAGGAIAEFGHATTSRADVVGSGGISVDATTLDQSHTVLSRTSTAAPATPASCSAAGATDTWTGGAGTTIWTDGGNWSKASPPTSSDFACLPANAPGTQSIPVPSQSLAQLLSFKPLILGSGIATLNGADFEANVLWQGGTLSGPSVVFGSGSVVTISGSVSLSIGVTVTNSGTVQIANGSVSANGPCSSGMPSWLNTGTLAFQDSGGASVYMGCGTLINQAGATVTKTGSSPYDTVGGTGQVENDGTVTSQSGVLA
jgi:hypothetical protein